MDCFQRRSGTSELKLSFGAVLIIILVLVVTAMMSFFWVLLTPRWSFTIATNKTLYAAGEVVQITVTLKNMGYIPQSITSGITSRARGLTSPIIVWVEEDNAQAWFAPSNVQTIQTTFTITPDQSLTGAFVWGGSWYDQKSYPGKYYVIAGIPNAQIVEISDVYAASGRQFYAYTEINITAV